MSTVVGQLFTPKSVQQEIRRRGYRCALFWNGHHFTLMKSHTAIGLPTKPFTERCEIEPDALVGVYDVTVLLSTLRDDMACVKAEEKAA